MKYAPTLAAFIVLIANAAPALAGPAIETMEVELMIDGERVVLNGAKVVRRGGRLIIEATGGARAPAGNRCDIKLMGRERVSLSGIVADHIAIYLDGNSRLDVGELTAQSISTITDGFSRVRIQGSE